MKKIILVAVVLVITGSFFPCFCAEIILKENPRRPIKAKTVELTDKEVKLIYPLEEVKSVNGITDISPSRLYELTALAHQYIEERKYSEAVDILKKTIEIDPSSTQMIIDISQALYRAKRYPEAIPYILKEIEINPRDGEAYLRLANAYRHSHKTSQEAIAAYEKAMEILGPTPENLFSVGETYRALLEKPDLALPYLEKAVTVDPDSEEVAAFFYISLGKCYSSLGKHQEAVNAFGKVIEKFLPSEGDGKAYYNAYQGQSQAYKALGQTEKALECERKAKETGFKK